MTHKVEARRSARAILAKIIAGAYPPGLRLPSELELADELSCGRSTIREALAELGAMGVVASRRGSGATVRDFRREGTPALLPAYLLSGAPDLDPLVLARELLHIRSLLASEAVRLAALYAPEGSLVPAREILARWSPKQPAAEQAKDEIALFRAIVGASGVWPAMWLANAYFAPMLEVHELLAPLVGGSPGDYGAVMKRLLDLVEAGDEEAALAHFHAWLARVDRTLLERLTKALGGDRPAREKREPKARAKKPKSRETSPSSPSSPSARGARARGHRGAREEVLR